MDRQPVGADPAVGECVQQGRDVAGGGDADRVAQRQLGAAELEQPDADVDDLVDRDVTLPRVAEAHRDVGAHVHPGRTRARDTTGANISIEAATDRFRLRWAKDSVALPKIAMSVTPRARARSRPRSLGTSTG